MSYSGSGGTNMAFAVQSDMVLPPIDLLGHRGRETGATSSRARVGQGRALGMTEPGAGSDVAGIERPRSAMVTNTSLRMARRRTAPFITNGTRARTSIVLVLLDRTRRSAYGCITLFVIDLKGDEQGQVGCRGSAFGRAGRETHRDGRCDTCELAFGRRSCPGRLVTVLGEEGKGSTTSPGSSRASASSPPRAATPGRNG